MHILIIHRIILEKELFFQEIIDLSCNIPKYDLCNMYVHQNASPFCLLYHGKNSSSVIRKNLKNWWSKLPINELKPLLVHII